MGQLSKLRKYANPVRIRVLATKFQKLGHFIEKVKHALKFTEAVARRCFPKLVLLEYLWWLLLNFLQNLLKVTVKKIVSQQSHFQKFLRNYFFVLAAKFLKIKITPLQVFGSFCLSLNARGNPIKLEPNQTSKMKSFANIINNSRGVFRMESNI